MYILDEEDKEELKNIWLSKDFDVSLPNFINKYSKKRYISDREKKTRALSSENEARALAQAMSFVRPISKEGGKHGAI
ncbi:TPA: hypothetical protein U2E07_000965 [Streptococcus suis]|nr:hypothetical protein [Streptococcus suis]HEM6498931.1 hypothetical protein [Streptococcus suis]